MVGALSSGPVAGVSQRWTVLVKVAGACRRVQLIVGLSAVEAVDSLCHSGWCPVVGSSCGRLSAVEAVDSLTQKTSPLV